MARRRSTSTIISATRPVFPSYLLPSWNFLLPRRVRRRSSRSSSSTSDESVSAITAATGTSPGGTSNTSTSTSTSSRGASTVPTTPPSPSSSASSSSSTTGSPSHQDSALQKPIAITPHRHHHHRQNPRVVLSRSSPDALRCVTCSTHLALTSQIVSKGFTGRNGRAYLVEPPSPGPPPSPQSAASTSSSYPTSLLQQRQRQRILHNIRVGRNEDRHLSTGWHVVADICCATCSKKVGWKYVDAKEESQRYKIGKFILETDRVMTHRSWEDFAVAADDDLGHFLDDDSDDAAADLSRGYGAGSGTNEVVFDSGDDDECDELFAGTWNAAVVAKRRSESVARRISHSLTG